MPVEGYMQKYPADIYSRSRLTLAWAQFRRSCRPPLNRKLVWQFNRSGDLRRLALFRHLGTLLVVDKMFRQTECAVGQVLSNPLVQI